MPLPIPEPRESGYTTTLQYPLYWAAYGPADAPKLLILHGGPGADHLYLLPQMLHLAEKYNCYFYDQRGGGKSRVDAHVDVTWKSHVDDLARIAQELGIDPLNIVGFSWGSMLTMLYMIYLKDDHPHPGINYPKPHSLVLINPAPLTKAYKEAFDANMAARKRSGPPAKGEAPATPFELAVAGYFAHPEMAQNLTPFRVIGRVQQSVWASIAVDFDDQETGYNILKHLFTFDTPTLITHGTNDPIPFESSQKASEITGSQFLLIPNCGHVPYVEEPDKLWAVVDPFLERAVI